MKRLNCQLVLDLSGPEGNAFVVLGRMRSLIKQVYDKETADEYYAEAVSGDYENLLRTTNKWVELVDSSNSYPHILPIYKVETVVERVR